MTQSPEWIIRQQKQINDYQKAQIEDLRAKVRYLQETLKGIESLNDLPNTEAKALKNAVLDMYQDLENVKHSLGTINHKLRILLLSIYRDDTHGEDEQTTEENHMP